MASAKSKNRPSKYLLKRARKNKSPFRNSSSKAQRRSSGWEQLKFFLDKIFEKSTQKIFDGDCHPATGKSSEFQGRYKVKGNLV